MDDDGLLVTKENLTGGNTSSRPTDIQPIESKSPLAPKTIVDAFNKVRAFKEGGSLSNKITQAIIYMLCKDGGIYSQTQRFLTSNEDSGTSV